MSFANHHILDIALSLIPPTVVQIRKNQGTMVNRYGQSEAAYSEWIEVYGIVQPGGEQNEHTQGIDFSKKHVTIWLRGIALDGTHIQWAPDQIRYVGAIYNVIGVKDWYPYDNYRECDCVEALNLGATQRNPSVEARPKRTPHRRGAKTPKTEQTMLKEEPISTPSSEPVKASTPTETPTEEKTDTQATVVVEPVDMRKETNCETPPNPMLLGKKKIRF